MKTDFAIIGLGVMGSSLALNLDRNGFSPAVYNRTHQKARDLERQGGEIRAYQTLGELVRALRPPRKILLMVPAGDPVDSLIPELAGLLEAGDILIDGGNSHYKDTERRIRDTRDRGFHFLGMGISGGQEGALWGPSLMPGGNRDAYEALRKILEKIAAEADTGPCVTYVGERGAGHFVKMVHNGIEYGDMQLIAEAYDLLRTGLGLGGRALRERFEEWNRGELESYLIDITAGIVNFPDDREEGILLDRIVDSAGQKGTGAWTSIAAGEFGVSIPTITAGVDARNLSALREERRQASGLFPGNGSGEPLTGEDWPGLIRDALYASKICAYAQGFSLMKTVSERLGYSLDLAEIARIWKAGCIIRAVFLDRVREAFGDDPSLPNLLLNRSFAKLLSERETAWERVVQFAVERRIPVPAMSASLAYCQTYRRARGTAYLIQAQRDYFGAHTYERTDQEGSFHTDWTKKPGT